MKYSHSGTKSDNGRKFTILHKVTMEQKITMEHKFTMEQNSQWGTYKTSLATMWM